MDNKLNNRAKELYDSINRYYTILIDSISPEDYNSIKDLFENENADEYDDHIKDIKSFIKPESHTTERIKNFILTYPEFQRKHYVKTINIICDEIERNPNKFKQEAYKGILRFAEELNNWEEDSNEEDYSDYVNDDDENSDEDYMRDNISNDEDEEIIYRIGNYETTLKTYGDPLLRNLYNILFMTFETNLELKN